MNPKGRGHTPNKIHKSMRLQLEKMLKQSSPHMIKWLARVANGYKYKYTKADGKVIRRQVRPNPAEAFKLALGLAEYVVPKLSRIDMEGGGAERNTFLIALQNNLKLIATEPTHSARDAGQDESDGEVDVQGRSGSADRADAGAVRDIRPDIQKAVSS